MKILSWAREFTSRIRVTPHTFQIRIPIIKEVQNIMKLSIKIVDNEIIVTGKYKVNQTLQ